MSELKLIEFIKKDMVEAIHVLNFENMEVQKELIEKQMTLFQSMKELHDFKIKNNISSKETVLENEEIELIVENSSEVQQDCVLNQESNHSDLPIIKNEISETPKAYRFERKVKAGFVPEIEGYVPEGIIRKLGLEHGDLVYATPMDTVDAHRKHYRYELAQKGDGIDSVERVQYNYCAVRKEAGRLVVDKSEETGQFIRYDEGLYTVVLEDYEVQEHQITEGSLIDIAYPIDKPQFAKVLWNHKISESDSVPIKNNTTPTPAPTKKEEKKEKTDIDQTLEDKTVLVIGNEPKKNLYKLAVELRGGEFLWADAKTKINRLEPLVRKSDLVVFLLGVSGHVGMEHIKQMCKDYGVSFETTWSKGQSGLIRLAEEHVLTTA